MAVKRAQTGSTTGPFYLKDYTHAAKTFLAEPGYTMAPKNAFLFHVRFNFNSPGDQTLGGNQSKTISVLCKSADLPKFNIEFDTLNKYNKKEIIPKKLQYEPVSLSFHDDVKNTIRDMWIIYNQYYFADSKITPEAWATDDTYQNKMLFNRYGLDQGPDVKNKKFLNSVDIYSMGNHKYTKYSLINPLITSFDFDKHDYSDGAKVMEIQMRLEYETVLYYEGNTEGIPGFGKDSPYYDNQFSTLGPKKAVSPSQVVNAIEEAIVKRAAPKMTQPYSSQTVRSAVPISPTLLGVVKAVASNARNNNRNFSFPTAYSIKNNSSLVDLTGKSRLNQQGAIRTAGFVVSNGSRVSGRAPSSYGMQNIAATVISNLIINAIIPAGMSAIEQEAFLQAYPPLPSSDIRTRSAPYV